MKRCSIGWMLIASDVFSMKTLMARDQNCPITCQINKSAGNGSWPQFQKPAKVGRTLDVIVDEVDQDAATCRTMADAPEIDGNLFIDEGHQDLNVGDIVTVEVDEALNMTCGDVWRLT